MNCPHCNVEMKEGRVENTSTGHMLGMFIPTGEEITFRGLFSGEHFGANIMSGDTVPAWHCERCGKVLVEMDVSK